MPKLIATNLTLEEFKRAVLIIPISKRVWPESEASVISQLFYSYLSPLLSQGAIKDYTLSLDDTYTLPIEDESKTLTEIFRVNYWTNISGDVSDDADFWRLLWCLWYLVRPIMLQAGWCNFLACAMQVVMPLLLREIVLAVAEPDPAAARRRAFSSAAWIAAGVVIQALAQQRQQHLSTRAGMRMRACLIAEIFNTATRLSPKGVLGMSKGQINNLVAVDAQKIFEVSLNVHMLWSSPLQVLAVSALLLEVSGVSTLLGIATLLAVLPLSKKIVTEYMALRFLRMKVTDERVRVISDVLSGIRVSKLNGWEPLWAKRLEALRGKEVDLTSKELYVFGISMVIMVMSPVVALVAIVSLRMLSDPDARLSAATGFATLGLIAALRFPINQLGQLLGQAAQAWKAAQRISSFLGRETDQIIAKDIGVKPSEAHLKHILKVQRASFRVGGRIEARSGESEQQSPGASSFTVKGVDLTLSDGELVCVVGPVASGKSSLLDGLLGFAEQVEGPCVERSQGPVAFSAQSAFVLNASVKDNILFGRPFQHERYRVALEASQLLRDMELLPAGDETEIGERGVTLSGGQKARVALARCIYGFKHNSVGGENEFGETSTLALLDDPLGALDASTAAKVFDALFASHTESGGAGALRGGGTILVTHAVHFLPRPEVSKIIVLRSAVQEEVQHAESGTRGGTGNVIFNGSWEQLVAAAAIEIPGKSSTPLSDLLASALSPHGDDGEDSDGEAPDQAKKSPTIATKKDGPDDKKVGTLMTKEVREEGVANLKTWIRWINAAGGPSFLLLQITFLMLDRAAYAGTEWWLAKWTEARHDPVEIFGYTMPAQDEKGSAWEWSRVYFGILAIGFVFVFARTQFGLAGGVRAAASIYAKSQKKILYAPMAFFDTTPLGRLLNRFSYDAEVVDVTMTMKANTALISIGWVLTGVSVMAAVSKGVMLIILCPVFFAMYRLQLFYRRSAVDLQRIDAVTRSPLQSLLAEGLDGTNTIRAFKMQNSFVARLGSALDENTGALLCWACAQRWMGIRLDCLAGVTAVAAAIVLATLKDELGITPGFAGMLMVWAFAQSISFMFMITSFTEAENAATSVERLWSLYEDTPQEPPHSLEEAADLIQKQVAVRRDPKASSAPSSALKIASKIVAAPKGWPWRGELCFENVFLRYRAGLDCALRGLSFTIPAGTRCGVVGRTGAGKSTLVSALFRLADEPLAKGRVLLDGVDLSTLCIRDVRARKPRGMVVIPQDPVLFSGSLRDCLDPFKSFADADLLDALGAVGLKNSLQSQATDHSTAASKSHASMDLLSLLVNEGGGNWSVGERQLLALARALLEWPRVLVLDEATASVDGDTDAAIQRMLRNIPRLAPGEVTVLSVAHRLHTVMDFDNILVMDAGSAAEYGRPAELLSRSGPLAQLVDATGLDSAKQLRAMANGAPPRSPSGQDLTKYA